MLHSGRPLEVEPAVLRATASSGARSLACHAASLGGGWRANPRTARDCVALPACPPAWRAWRLAPPCGRPLEVEHAVLRATPPVMAADGIGTPVPFGIVSLCRRDCPHGKPGGLLHLAGGPLRWSTQSCVPRRQSWRRMALEPPHSSGLCRSTVTTAGMASLAACSTAGGALRWSAQSCVPRRQSWRRMAWELPHSPGLCGSADVTARMASLAACSIGSGGAIRRKRRRRGSRGIGA